MIPNAMRVEKEQEAGEKAKTTYTAEDFGNGVYFIQPKSSRHAVQALSDFVRDHPKVVVVAILKERWAYTVITREKLPVAGEEAIAEAPDSLGHLTQWIKEEGRPSNPSPSFPRG